jgi:membrane associated rhomboid family serine protease
MGDLSRPDDGPLRFGTEAFYASIGRAFVVMCGVVPVVFLIWVLDWSTGYSFTQAGALVPRSPAGLDGVLFAHLLHGSFQHVTANSVPLILLGTFVLAGGVRQTLWSTGLIMLVAGAGVWLLGNLFFTSDAVRELNPGHIGASGVVFGFMGLLLTRGIVERSWWNVGVAVLIGVLYGWQLQGALPGPLGISWEGHLFGFLGGVVAAILFRRRRPKRAAEPPAGPFTMPDFELPR